MSVFSALTDDQYSLGTLLTCCISVAAVVGLWVAPLKEYLIVRALQTRGVYKVDSVTRIIGHVEKCKNTHEFWEREVPPQ